MENETTRREFIQEGGYSLFGLWALLNGCSALHRGHLSLDSVLNQPATNNTKRGFPSTTIGSSDGIKVRNFLEHINRSNFLDRIGGIDYAPIGNETEIVPIASGDIVGNYINHPKFGTKIEVHHGAGFISYYCHLKESFVRVGNFVNRITIIGSMGKTGLNAKGIVHTHLGLLGPHYTKFLKLDHVQYYPVKGSILSPYLIDAEELSILGKHKPLPFQIPENLKLDEQFGSNVRKAREEVDEFLKLFPHIKRDRFSERINSIIKKYAHFTDFTLDRDIADLYTEVSKEKPTISKPEADKIKSSLENMMTKLIPRFTAPIRDDKNQQYYDYSKRKWFYS